MIDIERVLADTPASAAQAFLDSAGSSLPPRPVLDEVIGHLRREAEVGGYRAAQERTDDLRAGYQAAAQLLPCTPNEIAFTDSATRSWLTALDAIPLTAGDRVLITETEYASNAIALLRRAQDTGARIETIPSDTTGALDLDALRAMLDERVKLLSLVHIPANGGLVNPVAPAADAAHQAGALVLLDACQSLGHIPLTAACGADIITATGRKWLRGPRGTGLLMVRRAAMKRLHPRLFDQHGAIWHSPGAIHLHPDARIFELWERNTAARLGLTTALTYANTLGIQHIHTAVVQRAQQLRVSLNALPHVTVHEQGEQTSGIVTFTVQGHTADHVRRYLQQHGVTVSVSRTSTTLLDMKRRRLTELVRASPHYFTTPHDLDHATSVIAALTPE
jgi:selenocysteine lyase/cysteine desulfurase